MTIKAYLSFIISLCLLATTITPAFATLPNEALFNWVEYKFADLFPQSQTVKSELTHEGIHYDLRSYSGAWGTRYLGITDDGEIIGLGDYTDGELKSFGYIDDWEDAIVTDNDNVFSNTNVTTSVVYSEKPNTSFTFGQDELLYAISSIYFTTNLQGTNKVFYWPTYFNANPKLPGLEFNEVAPDQYELVQELPDVSMGLARKFVQMDTDDPTIKRFAIVDQGLEIPGASNENFEFGDVWVATDYSSGFEFEKISENKAFYHYVDAYDIDDNGYDDLVAVNMGVRGGDYQPDTLHTFSQYDDGQFEQIDVFNRNGLPDNPWFQIGTSGSVIFADLDNDGDKELIQGAYAADYCEEQEWGAIRIWEINNYGEYQQVNVSPREGVFSDTTFGASGIDTIDYNKDRMLDILVFVENRSGHGQGIELYRNDGNYQFTRVTETVIPDAVFMSSDTYASRELYVGDINNDGLDDIICNPMLFGTDIDAGDKSQGEYWDDGEANGFQYNIGSSIWLNTGSKFERQINNPTYIVRVQNDYNRYPCFMRFMNTKNGITRFFGLGRDGEPIVIKIQY